MGATVAAIQHCQVHKCMAITVECLKSTSVFVWCWKKKENTLMQNCNTKQTKDNQPGKKKKNTNTNTNIKSLNPNYTKTKTNPTPKTKPTPKQPHQKEQQLHTQ